MALGAQRTSVTEFHKMAKAVVKVVEMQPGMVEKAIEVAVRAIDESNTEKVYFI